MNQKPESLSDTQVGSPESVRRIRGVERLFQPIDIGMIALFRMIFGSVMLFEVYRYASKGWIASGFIRPEFHFTFYGFSWVRPWPGNGMDWHFGLLGVLAAMITVGLFYRVAAVLFFFAFTYVFLLDQALYLNHLYLICLLSLSAIFLPAQRSWSLDVLRRPGLRSETAPVWTLWLLRFQIGAVYVFGGVAKIDADWLEGAFMRSVLGSRTDFPLIGRFFHDEWMVQIFVYGGLLFDLFIVPLLLWKRTRIPAYIAVILFHSMNAKMFRIGIFPLFMVAVSMLFFPADSLNSESSDDKVKPGKGKSGKGQRRSESDRHPVSVRRQWIIAFLFGIYVTVQILMPLRHWLYPGNVNWTEEGHRFSWHMKLRSKRSKCKFIVTDARGMPIDVRALEAKLTNRQRRVMAGRPDMVLQFAHIIARRLKNAGFGDVTVRVQSSVSLNGRDPQAMIDPKVDLAKEERNLHHATWIVPLTTKLPLR